MIIEKLKNVYSALDLRSKINEIIDNLLSVSDNVDNVNDIYEFSIKSSEWTGDGSSDYTYTKLSLGSSKVLSIYKTSGDDNELVFPDKVILNKNGTLTIKSSVKFDGVVVVSVK